MNFEEILASNSFPIPDSRSWAFLDYNENVYGADARFIVQGVDEPEYMVTIRVENAGNPLMSNLTFRCDCGQYQYRLAYANGNAGLAAPPYEFRPSYITNPDFSVGLCKHVYSVLKDWPYICVEHLFPTYYG